MAPGISEFRRKIASYLVLSTAYHIAIGQTGGRSAAFAFLCRCLVPSPSSQQISELCQIADSPAFKWTEFVDLATDQLVAPLVAQRFEQLGLNPHLPNVVERYFSAMIRLNRIQNTHLRKEALEIAAAFAEIDVIPVFIKGGGGLLSGLYDDIGIRIMSDLDVLIPFGRGHQCVNRLTRLGYDISVIEKHPRMHSLGTFLREGARGPVDLHHEVLAYPNERLISAQDVMNQAVEIEHNGVSVKVPSLTHQIVLNVAHSQLSDSDYIYGRIMLRSLFDYTILSTQTGEPIDWHEVEARFTRIDRNRALTYHRYAARELLSLDVGGDPKPSLAISLLLWRGKSLMAFPRLQRFSYRFIRIGLLLRRELSAADLRARLVRNLSDRDWWKRHVAIFRKGGR